jgi:hypothetical protein
MGFGVKILSIVEGLDVAQGRVDEARPGEAVGPVEVTVFQRAVGHDARFGEDRRGRDETQARFVMVLLDGLVGVQKGSGDVLINGGDVFG